MLNAEMDCPMNCCNMEKKNFIQKILPTKHIPQEHKKNLTMPFLKKDNKKKPEKYWGIIPINSVMNNRSTVYTVFRVRQII